MTHVIDVISLKSQLDQIRTTFSTEHHRANDPVSLVWSYSTPLDQEVVAAIVAPLSYGRTSVFIPFARRVLELLGATPHDFLLHQDLRQLAAPLTPLRYRMTSGLDILDLLHGIQHVIQQHHTLHALYQRLPGDHLERLSALVQKIRNHRLRPELTRGLSYLTTDPLQGSTAKRLHMFARWMVRGPDSIDLGLWTSANPADLIIPVDTHISTLSRQLGLVTRKTDDLITAKEITAFLKQLSPDDPLQYDFPLCHLGISKSELSHFMRTP